ncbi:Histidinol dehydrogenase [Candidatus Desulfarcum epimagneticum]|uniref:Histidinol dehydrogenase n=1 Tax=uncultured Desulfobacteraceae bacterium TaxID=218296 RepID=A0A484HK55_9BACT|nr:Histidinol dehydrogenase [uncultured Desulfobacteraceae bacterium]
MSVIPFYDHPSPEAEKKVRAISERGLEIRREDIEYVTEILEDVRKNGDRALLGYVRRFDSDALDMDSLRVSEREMEEAFKKTDPAFLSSLEKAASQVEAFHRLQSPRSWIHADRPGTLLGQLANPVDRAGVYVPGGRGGDTPLVSSVLMGVIPAKIAGAGHVSVCAPSRKDGSLSPHILAAAKRTGADAVYKIGSAWAIAALAYGTETIERVDVIAGPGNMFVTLAKKIVSGSVGIDMIAGPSEVLVIADREANPAFIAADLLSQAEHDPLSSSILITDSRKTADETAGEIESQLKGLSRRDIAEKSMARYGAIVIVKDIDAAIGLSNRMAPEHLELHIQDPFSVIGKIRNAGAVFMGSHTPEPVGDYIAGPNHVLPTAGAARFASALSVDHFVKKTSLIYYTREAFEKEAEDIIRLAGVEGLGAHVNSVKIRLKNS